MCDTEAISLQHLRTYSYYKQHIRPSASILNHEKYSFIDASFLVPNYKEHSRLLPYSPVPPTPTERCVAFAQALPAATSLCSCYLNLKQNGACGGRGEWITAACVFSFETSVFFPPTMHLNAQLSGCSNDQPTFILPKGDGRYSCMLYQDNAFFLPP